MTNQSIKKTIISPSLLSADFFRLEETLQLFNSIENLWIHLDVMDGHFVPNLTFGPFLIEQIAKKTHHPLDVHLMVNNPLDHLHMLKELKIHNVTIHVESTIHLDRMISYAKSLFPSVGLSFNPSTPLSFIAPYIFEKVDLVLLMSVNPGFSAQSFIPAIINKTIELNDIRKRNNYQFMIQIDGGINHQTSKLFSNQNVENFVSGSYIFSSFPQKLQDNIENLRLHSS